MIKWQLAKEPANPKSVAQLDGFMRPLVRFSISSAVGMERVAKAESLQKIIR
jgi:hypothetical protein